MVRAKVANRGLRLTLTNSQRSTTASRERRARLYDEDGAADKDGLAKRAMVADGAAPLRVALEELERAALRARKPLRCRSWIAAVIRLAYVLKVEDLTLTRPAGLAPAPARAQRRKEILDLLARLETTRRRGRHMGLPPTVSAETLSDLRRYVPNLTAEMIRRPADPAALMRKIGLALDALTKSGFYGTRVAHQSADQPLRMMILGALDLFESCGGTPNDAEDGPFIRFVRAVAELAGRSPGSMRGMVRKVLQTFEDDERPQRFGRRLDRDPSGRFR